jgi:hypothetical protein
MKLGLDTDFKNELLEFPTITICPQQPYNVDRINETLNGAFDSDDATNEILLKSLTELSFDNIEDVAKIALNISEESVSELTRVV